MRTAGNFIAIIRRVIAGLDSAHPAHDLLIYLLYVAATAILLQTQEIPTSLSEDEAITRHSHKVFNPDLSYYGRRLKIQKIQELQPEIIVYGNSWVNQFRAGMFAPYGFYNCANQSPKLNSAKSFITDAKRINPNLKIAIIMLHPWHFRSDVYEGSLDIIQHVSRPVLPLNKYFDRLERKDLYKMITTLDTSKTIGIRAIPQTRGQRFSDGSVTFGRHHERTDAGHRKREEKLMSQAEYHMSKKRYFRGYNQAISPKVITLIASVTADIRAQDVTPIYLIPPIHDRFIQIMDRDTIAYQQWHELKSTTIQEQLNAIAPIYDFSEFSSFGGTTDMTYDSWHSTELAAHLMVEQLKSDPRSPELLRSISAIPIDSIRSWYPTPVYSLYDGQSR